MIRQTEQLVKKLNDFSLLTKSEIRQLDDFFLWVELSLKEKSEYIKYIEVFNKTTGKKYKASIKSKRLFYEDEHLYSLPDRVQALKNCLTDVWIKENSTIVTPEWALKSETVAKYINFKASKKTKTPINETNLSEI